MGSSTSKPTTSSSELANAVPLKERMRIPDNEPVLPDHQRNHIPIKHGDIDYDLKEIYQKAYVNGTGKEKGANLRIPYFPSGFTVGAVLRGDLGEISNPNGDVRPHKESIPEKTAVHLEFCEPAYRCKAHRKQKRTPSTRAKCAKFVAEEIWEVIAGLPNFPYTLDQIKVVSIDVLSRGTVQPRIFVSSMLSY